MTGAIMRRMRIAAAVCVAVGLAFGAFGEEAVKYRTVAVHHAAEKAISPAGVIGLKATDGAELEVVQKMSEDCDDGRHALVITAVGAAKAKDHELVFALDPVTTIENGVKSPCVLPAGASLTLKLRRDPKIEVVAPTDWKGDPKAFAAEIGAVKEEVCARARADGKSVVLTKVDSGAAYRKAWRLGATKVVAASNTRLLAEAARLWCIRWRNPKANLAEIPAGQLEENGYDWYGRHEKICREKPSDCEIALIGDSITHNWAGDVWQRHFGRYKALNCGFGWDRTGNVLWRIDHGELDGISPKLAVVHIGGNNWAGTDSYVSWYPWNAACPRESNEETALGVMAVVERVRAKLPKARIVVMGVFPFGEKPTEQRRIDNVKLNQLLKPMVASVHNAVFLDINDRLLGPDGVYSREIAADFIHPTAKGYDIWFAALQPEIEAALRNH